MLHFTSFIPSPPTPFAAARDRLSQTLTQAGLTTLEIQTLKALQAKLDDRIIEIALLGLVSCGKSSLLNAIAGCRVAETGALHGVTRFVTRYEVSGWQRRQGGGDRSEPVPTVVYLDTPGLDEMDGEERARSAQQVAHSCDVVLFVANGYMTAIERAAIAQLRARGKRMLLVLNKSDLYGESERTALVTAWQQEFTLEEIVQVAAAPQPVTIRICGARSTRDMLAVPVPQIAPLKVKLLQIVNREGKALLVENVLRSLAAVNAARVSRALLSLPSIGTMGAVLYLFEGILLAAQLPLAGDILGCCGLGLGGMAVILGQLPRDGLGSWYREFGLWSAAIVLNAAVLAALDRESSFPAILWAGVSIPAILKGFLSGLEFRLISPHRKTETSREPEAPVNMNST